MSEAVVMPIELDASRLFFSTTDRRGVIEKVNSVFMEMSRFTWGQLVGAPHNIIRHPDMPGGAFKLMWDTLQAGEPFCAYVVNQAADHRPYTVFATITPLGDGYLSVRSRPCVAALHDAAFSLYEVAREREVRARADGASAAGAASVGLATLAELLPAAGVSDYNEFVWAALPAEVEARVAVASPLPTRAGEGPLFEMLEAVHGINAELRLWFDRLDQLARVAADIAAAAQLLQQNMAEGRQTAQWIDDARTESSAPIWLAVKVWQSMLPELDEVVTGLVAQINQLAESCAKTRFRIALARLHSDATGQFITELMDDPSSPAPRSAITDLCQALSEGSAITHQHSLTQSALAVEVASQIQSVSELLSVPQSLLGNWREMAASRSVAEFAEVLPLVADQLARGERTIGTLQELATECGDLAQPLEVGKIDSMIDEIEYLSPQVLARRAR